MPQTIQITLKKDQIGMRISPEAGQEDIIRSLKKKLPELKKLYQEEKTPIFVTGKVLKNKEIKQIQNMIQKEINVKIEFDSPKVLGLHGIKKTYNRDVGQSETKFHHGSLRSGQRMEFEGSLVILGDVNDGAEVIASENVVVLGHLRGLAHAGAKGNKKAIIAAESIDSMQLRIANIVKEMEKKEEEYNIRTTYAYVEKEEIVLE